MQSAAFRVLEPIAWANMSPRMEAGDEQAVLRVEDVPHLLEAASVSAYWLPLGEAAPVMASFVRGWVLGGDAGSVDDLYGDEDTTIEEVYARACRDYQEGRRRQAAIGFIISYGFGRRTAPVKPHLPAVFGLASIAAGVDARELSDQLCQWLIKHDLLHPRVFLLLGLNALESDQVAEARRYLMQVAQLGRHNPKFREDQHSAQRILIGIQFGITPNASPED